jgi:type I restriction-modification system DNA methylase subunit
MPLNTLEQQENESPPDGYAYKQGDKVYLEGDRPFEIENIGMFDVHLRDLVFPILSRAVPVKEFERLLIDNPLNAHLPAKEVSALDEQAGELLAETEMDVGTEPFKEAPDKPEATAETSQTPEISVAQPVPNHVPINYRITDDDLGAGGAKTKYGFNVAAIRTLQGLESENRMATADDQETLAKYVGWGGISQAFDKDNTSWTKEYTELKGLLSESEYASARQSTLNAHYTSPTVIKAIYTAIENMGFQTGNILEPAMGVGNFFGLVPQSMAKSKLYGVELDSITGRIAKQLYQSARISVQGFENTDLPDSFFDLAIGNVPFGQYRLADKTYDKYNFLIHDYFLAKTLDKVRPSGIIAFITSKGTMDKQSPEVRKYIARRAELIGAVRLPNNAFLSNAETDVTADIIFLQKRDRIIDVEPEWVQLSKTEDGIPINSYYATNPDMVLGKMVYDKSMYGDEKETSCHPFPDAEFAEQLHEAIENIHAEFPDIEPMEELEQEDASIPADPGVRNFSFTLADGQIYYRENSRMNRVEISKTAENRIRGMIEIRDCTRRLITLQTEDYHDSAIKTEQEKLNALYDSFTKQYGLLNSRGNSMAFSDDASYALLCSLEVINENGELERKADMFSKRTIRRHPDLAAVDTASEALALSLSEKACVDMAYMNRLTSLSEEEIVRDLRGVIFLNPLLNDERRLQGLTYAGK